MISKALKLKCGRVTQQKVFGIDDKNFWQLVTLNNFKPHMIQDRLLFNPTFYFYPLKFQILRSLGTAVLINNESYKSAADQLHVFFGVLYCHCWSISLFITSIHFK